MDTTGASFSRVRKTGAWRVYSGGEIQNSSKPSVGNLLATFTSSSGCAYGSGRNTTPFAVGDTVVVNLGGPTYYSVSHEFADLMRQSSAGKVEPDDPAPTRA